jgi:hypothetical protein
MMAHEKVLEPQGQRVPRGRINTARLGAGFVSSAAAGAVLAAAPAAANAYTLHQYCNKVLKQNINCSDPYYHHLQENLGATNDTGASLVCINEWTSTHVHFYSRNDCGSLPEHSDYGVYLDGFVWNDGNGTQHLGGNHIYGSVVW